METFKIGICEPQDFSLKAIKSLKEIGEVNLFQNENIHDFIVDKDIIFVRLKYAINHDLVRNAKNLKYICSPTTGLNHIKLMEGKYKIISLKGEYEFLDSIRATPEHVFGLTLSLLRNYSHAFLNRFNNIFDRNLYKGYELYNNTVGIIGLGRVGKIIAGYYHAFGARVYYYDVENKDNEIAVKCSSIEEVISKSNIIILSINYTSQNKEVISREYFEIMKGKYFINASRGELVDEIVLLEYLKRDWFKGVAIDVIAEETSESSFLKECLQLTKIKNLIITPHIGGATFSSMARTEEFITEKLIKDIKYNMQGWMKNI